MLSPIRLTRSPVRQVYYLRYQSISNHQPPSPRPFKPAPSRQRPSKDANNNKPEPAKEETPTPSATPRKGFIRHFWPFSKGIRNDTPIVSETPDLAKGQDAADMVVKTGHLDPKYQETARHVTRIICAMPVVIVVGYMLYQRRFEGVEQKKIPRVKRQEELR